MFSPNVTYPRRLFETFLVERKITRIDTVGNQRVTYEQAGTLRGIVSACRPDEAEKFRGLKHSVTRKIVSIGGGVRAQIGDRLVKGDAVFLVEHVECPANLGKYMIYFISERGDLR